MNFNIINNLRLIRGSVALALVAVALMLGSCDGFMHDDLPACATRPDTRANVNFIYDYNAAETDNFADFVGAVTLYAFDAQGRLVLVKEHTVDEHGINSHGYSMPIELPAGKYTLYASARENTAGYEASLQTPGAKFRRTGDTQGTTADAIFYTLDHQGGLVDHQQQSLEHFWLTREAVPFEITVAPMPAEGAPQPADVVLTANVPLQRVTNNIWLNITRALPTRADGDQSQPLSVSDYDVRIVTTSAADRLDLVGNHLSDGTPLTYTPYKVAEGTLASGRPRLRAYLSTSKLIHEDDPADRTRLEVTAKRSGQTFTWDLTSLLAEGNKAYAAKGWSTQEYLDRESQYDITVDFDEQDNRWRYIEISVGILNWSKRIQNVDL